jgi:hypothetical protein
MGRTNSTHGEDEKNYRILLAKSNGKVKLSLCFFLTKHHAMKAYRGSGSIAPRIL